MTEEYWTNSPFSIARYTGCIKAPHAEYILVNKEGKDIFECSAEAQKEGRKYAIEPGEPADLVDKRYLPIYRKIGRDKFIEYCEKGDIEGLKKEGEGLKKRR